MEITNIKLKKGISNFHYIK